jgi:hypothetical protein
VHEAYLGLAAVTKIVAAWAREKNVSDGARDKFLKLLQAEWILNAPIGETKKPLFGLELSRLRLGLPTSLA